MIKEVQNNSTVEKRKTREEMRREKRKQNLKVSSVHMNRK